MRKIRNLVNTLILGAGLGILTGCATLDRDLERDVEFAVNQDLDESFSIDFRKDEIARRERNLLKCVEMGVMNNDVLDCLIKTEAIIYKSEPEDQDYWQSPQETEERMTGDCDCMNAYLKYLLEKKGIKAKIRVGYLSLDKYIKDGSKHLWLEFEDAGKTYIADATGPMCLDKKIIYRDRYLPIPNKDIDLEGLEDFKKRTGLNWEVNEGIKEYPDLEKLAREINGEPPSILKYLFLRD